VSIATRRVEKSYVLFVSKEHIGALCALVPAFLNYIYFLPVVKSKGFFGVDKGDFFLVEVECFQTGFRE